MRNVEPLDEATIAQLRAWISGWSGFVESAVSIDAVRKAADVFLSQGLSRSELVARAMSGDPALAKVFSRAIAVGETYFFRQSEHFDFLTSAFLPARLGSGARNLRAWSAGCATGEEAYSLAGCLLEAAREYPSVSIEVVGTDLVEENIRHAERATYGKWSTRTPIPAGFAISSGDKLVVASHVKRATRFEVANLLRPPSALSGFDIVMCRNVLVYFERDAAKVVCENLATAVAPGGCLVFGTLDVNGPPDGFSHLGPTQLNVFVRDDAPRPARSHARTGRSRPPRAGSSRPRRTAPSRRPRDVKHSAPTRTSSDHLEMHLRALEHVERGDRDAAARLLSELVAQAPDYLPGVLERALLHIRSNEPAAAASLMREILRRTQGARSDAVVQGPEELTIAYYRETAEVFLRRRGTR